MPFALPIPAPGRRAGPFALAASVLLAALAPAPVAAGEGSLREKLLEERYGKGDYAFYAAWHDPWAWQFDLQSDFAWPFGGKMRLRLGDQFLFEVDGSYYRAGSEADFTISTVSVPEIDGLVVAAGLQWSPRIPARVRPYVGGGPVFVSLSHEFPVVRPDVRAFDPTNPDRFTLARWSRFDLGAQVTVGLDIPIGRRAFPFVEMRWLFGSLTVDDHDVKIASFSLADLDLAVEELETLPPDRSDPDSRGRNIEAGYDWSGPLVAVGLKIRF